jgi:hypothetical protein
MCALLKHLEAKMHMPSRSLGAQISAHFTIVVFLAATGILQEEAEQLLVEGYVYSLL